MKRRNVALLLPLTIVLGLPVAGYAQDDDSLFEEITVTATKRAMNIYDVPVAMSAFTAETIERQGISDLMDIGKFVPNLNVTAFPPGTHHRPTRSFAALACRIT